MTTNLLLALHAEHKQRTGHDCTKPSPHQQLHSIFCDVCLYLRVEFKAIEKAEADHYEQQAKEAEVSLLMLKNLNP